MSTHIINPQNWCDDEVKIVINKNMKTVRIGDIFLTLKFSKSIHPNDTIIVKTEDSAFVTLFNMDGEHEWYCEEGDVSREHKNPYILAAIMACNLI